MEKDKLELAEAHLRTAEAELEAAKAAEKSALEELHVAEEAEQAALRETKKAIEEVEEALHPQIIHFKVDGEKYETCEKHLTPNQIIRDFAERDPATHYLKELAPHERSFKGEGDKKIEMRDGMEFVVMATGPMTVSDGR